MYWRHSTRLSILVLVLLEIMSASQEFIQHVPYSFPFQGIYNTLIFVYRGFFRRLGNKNMGTTWVSVSLYGEQSPLTELQIQVIIF